MVVSGYFNPLHAGHLDYLEAAAQYGRLTVIVNSDLQVRLKGSVPFMPARERARVVASLRVVDRTAIAMDSDRGVTQTLRRIHQGDPVHYFCNGGDVSGPESCLERAVCEELGVRMVFGVGGPKTFSSSQLIHEASRWDDGRV